MIDHNCQFCLKPTKDVSFGALQSKFNMKITFCANCLAEYIFFRDNALSHYSLYTTISNKLYRWTVNTSSAWLRAIGKPGIPGKTENEDIQLIKGFKKDIPNINPQNINEKISTYLVFL